MCLAVEGDSTSSCPGGCSARDDCPSEHDGRLLAAWSPLRLTCPPGRAASSNGSATKRRRAGSRVPAFSLVKGTLFAPADYGLRCHAVALQGSFESAYAAAGPAAAAATGAQWAAEMQQAQARAQVQQPLGSIAAPAPMSAWAQPMAAPAMPPPQFLHGVASLAALPCLTPPSPQPPCFLPPHCPTPASRLPPSRRRHR